MECYECHSLHRSTSAVAVCRECGVALCASHLHVETQQMRKEAGLGKSTSEVPARRVVCPTCRRAELSA
ncbi:putative hypothetical protein [Streptomyces sp. NBRC 110611]|uniref:DUF2180 family protein n=1 Tax=Streptomyces sp. NBRC 110611 TaxID=1621259 RepID=UPI0008575E6F|nr:DUF2180 family protein [Streptomyces sp. NBRC 110611]GAU71145.1 putative hypothetical protein [Streptomyces sp. NBRC 110611]